MGNLSEEKYKQSVRVEDEKFIFANLLSKNEKAWKNIRQFYGINDEFPAEYLYFQKTEQ